MDQHHFIRKQRFELHIGKGSDAFGIQQSLSDFFWSEMAPKLQHLFDDIVDPEQVVSIDKVEIDLGHISVAELISSAGLDKVLLSLQTALRGEIISSGPQVKFTAKPKHIWDQWLYFLKNGSLPWSASSPDKKWNDKVLEALIQRRECVDELRTLLTTRPDTIDRLVWQFPEPFLVPLLEIYSGQLLGESIAKCRQVIGFIIEINKTKPVDWLVIHSTSTTSNRGLQEYLWNKVWKYLINEVVVKGSPLKMNELIEYLLANHLKVNTKEPPVSFETYLSLILRHEPIRDYLIQDIPMAQNASKPAFSEKAGLKIINKFLSLLSNKPTQSEVPIRHQTQDNGLDVLNKRHQAVVDNSQEVNSDQVLDEEAQYVNYGGLVLLHPFLAQFFQGVELTTEKKFINPGDQQSAVHLLYYLATGDLKPDEYHLTIPKLLCGLPLNMPIPRNLHIPKSHRKAGDNLLQAVIDHWENLGNTSTDGLREGFLSRPGRLTKEHNGWGLLMEQQSIDVLLDRLPWTLSLIKLPWIKETIRVDWR